ncbi:MAG: hypothetical protein C4527_25225 [Candidatus Omnitrophota bacterium]|nr:MAG: hypothetical protein C4527_25225 [Candidatus Omnitrophota bacterium]
MSVDALITLRDAVRMRGELPVDLELKYKVVFSTLQGNLPVNCGIVGTISGIPIDLEMGYTVIPNTMGSFPVNTGLSGTIGDVPFSARMPYKIVFSTIAGNIPINTGMQWESNGKTYFLRMPYSLVPGAARGGGPGSGGVNISGASGMKARKMVAAKFIRGKMMQPDEMPTSGAVIPSEAGRPICTGIHGCIDNVVVDIRFRFTYFCNTSSGRNPINIRAIGCVRAAA